MQGNKSHFKKMGHTQKKSHPFKSRSLREEWIMLGEMRRSSKNGSYSEKLGRN